MATKKQEKGHYITFIGTLNSQDQFLLDLLIENGFLLEKCVKPCYASSYANAKEVKELVTYRIYMEDDQ
jgi:hypothetical protein